MLQAFRRDGTLLLWGGVASVKAWDSRSARRHQEEYAHMCESGAIRRMQEAISTGKREWLLRLIRDWQSARPLDVIGCGRAGRALLHWLLSEHNLEIETGRHARVPRQQRWCKRCLHTANIYVLGDELHCLTTCLRGEVARASCLAGMAGLFDEAQLTCSVHWGIMDFMGRIKHLSPHRQNRLWQILSVYLLRVDDELAAEGIND